MKQYVKQQKKRIEAAAASTQRAAKRPARGRSFQPKAAVDAVAALADVPAQGPVTGPGSESLNLPAS